MGIVQQLEGLDELEHDDLGSLITQISTHLRDIKSRKAKRRPLKDPEGKLTEAVKSLGELVDSFIQRPHTAFV
jgi:hypothetical protein